MDYGPVQPETKVPDGLAAMGDDVARTHRLATLGTLAASIAHEVNNILTPVLSYAQLALASPEDRELTQKALQRAVDCTTKASRIGSAMLGFVRVTPGGGGMEPRETSVAVAVADAVLCLGRDLAKDGIALVVRVDPKLTAAIEHVSMQQVVLNLLLNAREAMRGRGGELMIDAERVPSVTRGGGGSTWNIRLRVSDSGRGMPAEVIDRAFDPFMSARTYNTTASGATPRDGGGTGTGLGLAVCRMLIERAGGTISAESVVDQGTVFTIVLPEASKVAGTGAAVAA